jgi:hypothetical protein
VTTIDEADSVGGLAMACAAVGRAGDLPSPPIGYQYASKPLSFPLDISVMTSDSGTLTIEDGSVTGGGMGDTVCNPATLTCGLLFFYGFADVPVGPTSATIAALPPGHLLASAEVFLDGDPAAENVDLAGQSVSMTFPSNMDNATVVFIANLHPALVRQSGADRYATAAAVSKGAFGTNVPVVYIATGANFPDALGAGPAAAKLGGPILLVRRDAIPAATATELTRLKPAKIVVVGGAGVVSDAVKAALGLLFE